jgi:hypothetical protein
MRLNVDVGASGLVRVAAASFVVETEVKTSVEPDRNANSLGVAVETVAAGPVAGGASDDASDAEAVSEALVGKLMMMVVDAGNTDSGRLQK